MKRKKQAISTDIKRYFGIFMMFAFALIISVGPVQAVTDDTVANDRITDDPVNDDPATDVIPYSEEGSEVSDEKPEELVAISFDEAVSYKKGVFKIRVHDSVPKRTVKIKVTPKAKFSVEKPSDTNGGQYLLKVAPKDFKKLRFKVDDSFDSEDMQVFLRGSGSNTITLKPVGEKLKGLGKFDISKDKYPHFSVELSPEAMPYIYVDFGTYGKMSDDGKTATYTLDGKKITVKVSKGGGFKDGQVGIPEKLDKVVFKLGGDFNPDTMHVLVGEKKNSGHDPFLVELYVKKGSYEVSLGKTDITPNGHFPKTVYFYVEKGRAVMTD